MQTAQEVIKDATAKMDGALKMLKDKFSGLRTGKASPSLVENVQVTYYGTPTRLRDMATSPPQSPARSPSPPTTIAHLPISKRPSLPPIWA